MFLLHFDESGPGADHLYVVGGIVAHEHDTWRLAMETEALARRLPAGLAGAELHADHIRHGRKDWRRLAPRQRDAVLTEVAHLMLSGPTARRRRPRFMAAVSRGHTADGSGPFDPVYETFFTLGDDLARRGGYRDRLLAVGDANGRLEHRLQNLVSSRQTPASNASRGNAQFWQAYAEVPIFLDSHASRLVQLADFVANAVYRFYLHGDDWLFRLLLPGFGFAGDAPSGLRHLNAPAGCGCPACGSR